MNFMLFIIFISSSASANEILGCGGFVKSKVTIDFSKIEIGLYTVQGALKEKTECAPNNGYYFLPLYEKGDYILRIHPPIGWSFQPSEFPLRVDGISDKCSTGQDINFEFNGFGITGQVLSVGQSSGPENIIIQLVSSNGEKRETVTSAGGKFHFTPVVPGHYQLKGFHSKWTLEPASAMVTVTEGNTELPAGIIKVKGYDVQGTVVFGSIPSPGVHVLLYSDETVQKHRVEGCKTRLFQDIGDAPLCYSETDSAGKFSFDIVPSGKYHLKVLTGENQLYYNIKPNTVPFSVLHNGIFLNKAFEVVSLRLVGKVESAPGSPMAGVRVSLNGEPVGVTDTLGKYTIPQISLGKYKLSFAAEIAKFNELDILVSPTGVNTLLLSRPSEWQVCGKVLGANHCKVNVQHDGGKQYNFQTDQNGSWCAFLPNGIYSISVYVSEEDRLKGLQFFPLSEKVVVDQRQVENVNFSQLKAKLRGRVICRADSRGQCDHIAVTLQPHGTVGQTLITTVKDGNFVFNDLFLGNYDLSVPSDSLCWVKNTQSIAVHKAEVEAEPFLQEGYKVYVTTSHDVEVTYTLTDARAQTVNGVWSIAAGPAAVCVPSAGKYTLVPRACHRFTRSQLFYSTDKPKEVVVITAESHLTTIVVLSDEKLTDLKLIIKNGATETIGPLRAKENTENSQYVYEHNIYLASGETIEVSVVTEQALISPRGPRSLVGSGACQKRAMEFKARRAAILAGQVRPPVTGVEITLRVDEEEQKVLTDSNGRYKFDPIEPEINYTITASKELYAISGPNEKGDFEARRLAQIIVQLEDSTTKKPINSVVVSLSGDDYRRNLMSPEDGRLVFGSLAPAQYYIKPLMKEYRFQPQHSIVVVEEGKTYELTFSGVRVAWSVRGRVIWAGGRGAAGTAVSAHGHEPQCSNALTQTDADGHFVLRALPPHCRYTIQANSEIQIETDAKDIEDVTLIALKSVDVTDVNVLIVADDLEFYKTFNLKLIGPTEETVFSSKIDSTGYSSKNNPGIMMLLPRLMVDNMTYEILLESSLSKVTHSYEMVSTQFKNDGKFKHFTLIFKAQVKAQEQDLTHTSILIMPLLGIIVWLILHKEKAISFLGERAGDMSDKILQKNKPPMNVNMQNVLDENQINRIVQNVNAVNRKNNKKNMQIVH